MAAVPDAPGVVTIIPALLERIAALLVGVEPRFVRVDVSDPIAFVLTENLHRRHLTPGQRAALALNIEAMYAAEAKSRQGARTDLKPTDFETDLSQSPADRKSAAKAAKAAKSRRLKGQISPTVEDLTRIAKVLGVRPADLLGEDAA